MRLSKALVIAGSGLGIAIPFGRLTRARATRDDSGGRMGRFPMEITVCGLPNVTAAQLAAEGEAPDVCFHAPGGA